MATPMTAEQIWLRNRKYEDYYAGLPGNPGLLARSSEYKITTPSFSDTALQSQKRTFAIQEPEIPESFNSWVMGNDDVVTVTSPGTVVERAQAILEDGRGRGYGMAPIDWIHIQFMPIGYSQVAEENPPCILVTVDPSLWTEDDEQTVADLMRGMFLNSAYEDRILPEIHVDVEFKEGDRATFQPEVLREKPNPSVKFFSL